MIIGILFLIKGLERVAILFLFIHLIMTSLPLILFSQFTWQALLVPTIQGQYIIKNNFVYCIDHYPWFKIKTIFK